MLTAWPLTPSGNKELIAAAVEVVTEATTMAPSASEVAREDCCWSQQHGSACDPTYPAVVPCSVRGCMRPVHLSCVTEWEVSKSYEGPSRMVCPNHHEFFQSTGGGKPSASATTPISYVWSKLGVPCKAFLPPPPHTSTAGIYQQSVSSVVTIYLNWVTSNN